MCNDRIQFSLLYLTQKINEEDCKRGAEEHVPVIVVEEGAEKEHMSSWRVIEGYME